MPYNLSDFANIAEVKSHKTVDISLEGGVNSIRRLPTQIQKILNSVGGHEYGGDFSRQDSAVITAMLRHGLAPEHVYATFIASDRGQNASQRKAGHFYDYVYRTITNASSYLSSNGNGNISVDFSRKRPAAEGDGIVTLKANEVEVERARWVWPGYIPAGKITILAGDPGMGKSTIALDLVSRISKGTFLPKGGRTISGTCLVASAEDAAEDTIAPRLIVAEANLSRIEIMREVKTDEEIRYLSFPRDLEALREAIVKRGARIAVIDPLNAFLGRETDSHRDHDVRLVLAPFEHIAEETGAAIVIIAHLNKKEEGTMLYRVGGSIGLIGAARSVLAVSAIEARNTRVLYSLKSNLARTPAALEYEVCDITRIREEKEWKGDKKVKSSIIRWLGEIDYDPHTKTTRAADAIEDFVRQMIGDNEVCSDEIIAEGRKAGISRQQIMRVRDQLGVRFVKKNEKWWWRFPAL